MVLKYLRIAHAITLGAGISSLHCDSYPLLSKKCAGAKFFSVRATGYDKAD